jgi:hypothetical protein
MTLLDRRAGAEPVVCDPHLPSQCRDMHLLTNMGNDRYKVQALHLSYLFQGLRANVCVLTELSICMGGV